MNSEKRNRAALLCIVIASAYLFTAFAVYRFRHPEMTETQLFLDTPKALTFR